MCSSGPSSCLYSPKCLEEVFSEVRMQHPASPRSSTPLSGPGLKALRTVQRVAACGYAYGVDFDEPILVPIVPCPRCEQRFVEDPNRDGRGDPIHLPGEDELEPPKCDECSREAYGEAYDADWLDTAARKLGLREEDKETLQDLKILIENSDRMVMVARVHDRVNELERRLEDRTAGIRDAVETKLENANTRVVNANTRTFIYSLIAGAALFLVGLLFGVLLTLLFGG